MQFTAYSVKWDLLLQLKADGQLEDALLEGEPEVELGETPWPSDSAIQHRETSEALEALGPTLPAPQQETVTAIQKAFINEDYLLPQDLGGNMDPELVAGSISPENVKVPLDLFSDLDLSPFDQDSKDYLQQWKEMLEYTATQKGGILFHLG